MNDDLVSVLIPAYNAESFIGETLRSVCGQTHRNLEIIVVDDGSTDATAEIVRTVAQRDDRVRMVEGEHRGLPATRNRAASCARGAYLAPCDSDDLWHPRKIELQLAALERGGNLGVAYCWSVGINEADEVVFPQWAVRTAEGEVFYAAIEDSLPGSGSATLMRRSYFDAVGGFPEGLSQGDEWQICIALASITEFVLVREYLVGYRLHSNSMSNDFSDVADSLARTTKWIANTWPDVPAVVMRRRGYTIFCYLAFLALRRRQYWKSLNYRLSALVLRPTEILSVTTASFFLSAFAQVFGVQRYYYAFWRRPRRWEGAPPVVDTFGHAD